MLKTALLVAVLACSSVRAADLKTEYLADLDGLEKKFVSLAEAMPAEKYSWRPAAGVRSVGEVFVHVASANGGLTRMFGIDIMPGLARDAEKTVTDKAQIVDLLKKSFAHFRKVADVAGEPDKVIKVFGRDMSQRGGMYALTEHLHEHLGQSIAYARSNGVTPPWSAGN